MNGKERIGLLRQGKRVFRARHKETNAFWEGTAETPAEAIRKAARATGQCGAFELRELTANGGWRKPEWEGEAA